MNQASGKNVTVQYSFLDTFVDFSVPISEEPSTIALIVAFITQQWCFLLVESCLE